MPESIVSLEDVRLTLPSLAGEVEILRGVNMKVAQGEAVAIVGPSGSGKTTLLMVIAGLESVTSGRIVVAGTELNGQGEDALTALRRDTAGIVFQAFHLIPTMTALENVSVPLEFKGVADAPKIAKSRLERVGLGHRLHHYPSQLSGGEQQRTAIARAVAAGCKIILADEPTGNLDQVTGEHIIDLLFDMRRETGATLLLVTHDRALARRCDRVIEVRDGTVLNRPLPLAGEEGAPSAVARRAEADGGGAGP